MATHHITATKKIRKHKAEGMWRGRRIARWTAIEFRYKRKKDRMWLFECICGVRREVSERAVRRGCSRSCGCLKADINRRRAYVHGMYGHKLYGVYKHMINRCHKRKDRDYKWYGARGIRVCNEWKKDRAKFFVWALSNGYKEGLHLERTNNNKGYSPANCVWATRKTNMNNTRRNRFLTWKGQRLTFSQWSKVFGFKYWVIGSRINAGWSVEDALTRPVMKMRRRK
jgi:hypothetical protein